MTADWAADWLVCANCAGRVREGGCAVCRAQLARLREQRWPLAALISPAALAAVLLMLAAIVFLVARPA
ncbi:hypothetical protein [Streptomyces sp. YIM 98790]|uniref:hypothetical protein n=1 Tax=Streptomyces sp. YIM 98790 TaxID=2689077 RepID=UPI0014093393|nr:hypothetical protein [Streptomyces sp. YIM 98790]